MKIILLISLVCSIAAVSVWGEEYNFRQRKGARETTNTWTRVMVKPGRIDLTATKRDSGEFNKMICDDGYNILEWRYTNKKNRTGLHAVRKNGSVHVSGEVKGKPINKTISVETSLWYQVPEFAIGRKLAAGQDSVIFAMFWIDKMAFFNMKAVRIGDEKIRIGGKDVDTMKVEVKLTGFKSIFWHSNYWFRKSDLLMVKYVGVNGIPGTKVTVIELMPNKQRVSSLVGIE